MSSEPPAVPEVAGADAPQVVGRPRILVVDDDPVVRLMVRRSLEPQMEVLEAADAETALCEARRALPDLVILDLVLPGLDGFGALEELRSLPGGGLLPVMVVTSSGDLGSISRAYHLGATDFVTKPIPWALLPHRAHYLLRSSRALRELKAWEETLVHRAQHDHLTDLPNRWLAMDRLGQELSRLRRGGEELAVLFVDLDGFKRVNDELGHGVGDVLLQSVGQRLRSCLRTGDTLARYGGDEFLAIVTGRAGQSLAEATARRLLEAMGEPFTVGGRELRVGASIGMAVAPEDGRAVAELVRRADRAMYRAKSAGGGTFRFFTRKMNRLATQRSHLESALARALTQAELSVAYQPIVEMSNGRPVAAEALLRWLTRDGDWVLPGEFLATAEESGLVVPISDWLLNEVCQRVAGWVDGEGRPLRLSVNASRRHLESDRVVERIVGILATHGLAPERLELEVTEAMVELDEGDLWPVLAALRGQGLSLALDDFGLGETSMRPLRSMLFDRVKIDRSVIRALPSPDAERTVRGITRLAGAFGLQAVAEGVETEAQRGILLRVGCSLGQGFLLGRPLGARAAQRRFERGGRGGPDEPPGSDQGTSLRASSSASSRVRTVPST